MLFLVYGTHPANSQPVESQQNETVEDEVIVHARRAWDGHKGMQAFWDGDYETAEFEFEKEFKRLKRRENGLYNMSQDTALGLERNAQISQATQSFGGGSAATARIQSFRSEAANMSSASNFRSSKIKGRNILNDGKDTSLDFGFTKYMAGLSEIQLGKYKEAKSSFKTAIHFDKDNFDARMRLGLLYLTENDIDKAVKQLEKIEKIWVKCQKKKCADKTEIGDAALTLANGISRTAKSQNHSETELSD